MLELTQYVWPQVINAYSLPFSKSVNLYFKDLHLLTFSVQTANGNVEAKVVCLFRRRDISSNLNTLADSNASE